MLFAATTSSGQNLLFTYFSNYAFPERFRTPELYGRIEDGYQWGLGLELEINDENAWEIVYQNMVTDAWYISRAENFAGSLSSNYLTAGYRRKGYLQDNFTAFGAIQGGMAWFIPDRTLVSSDVARPALGARAGFRYQPAERIALHAHAQLLSPIQWFGLGFILGTRGSSVQLTGSSTILQFSLGGSVSFRLN